MDTILHTVKNLVFYLILVTLIKNLIGNTHYAKYVDFFMGIVMILIVVAPLSSLLHLDETLAYYLNFNAFQFDLKEEQTAIFESEEKVKHAVYETYKLKIIEQVEGIAKEEDLSVVSCEVILSEEEDSNGKIQLLYVTLKQKNEEGIKVDKIRIGEKKQQAKSYQSLEKKLKNAFGLAEEELLLFEELE